MVNDMSEQVRCPMCGKPNPADAEVCRYCHARLKPLRPGEIPQPQETSDLESNLPDWMRQIQEESAPAQAEADDLLQAFRDEVEEVLPEAPATEDEDLWAEMGAEEDDLPDWLKSLGEETAPEASAPSETGPAAAEDDLPDWLGDTAPADEETATDALGGEEPAAEPGELPDWLETLGTEAAEPAAEAPVEEEGLPDWLSSAEPAAEETATDALGGEEPAAEPGELPDWLETLGTEAAEPAAEVPAEEEDLPDWLSSAEPAAKEIASDALGGEEPAAEPGELPDWLETLGTETAEPAAEVPAEEEGLPDWLSSAEPAAEKIASDALGGEEPAAEPGELPDWLEALEASAEAGPEEAASLELEPIEAESEAEEAEGSTAQPFVFEGEEDLEDLLGETPDWLDLLSPDAAEELTEDDHALPPPLTADEAEEPLEEEATPSVLQGELPSWLEAMRPVTAAAAGAVVGDEPVETQGPLAGLRGVITPPEPSMMKPGKVALVGGRLVLTEQQEAQVKALQALLDDEFDPQPPPKPPLISQQQALRWLIGGLLLLAALLPLLIPPLRPALPSKILPAALNAQRLVEEVPENAPVLLAVDYSPGFTSEMETASAPLLSDLLSKNVRLVVVSTQPTGPDLSTHLLTQALAWRGIPGENYINLGYLPGGTAGLYAFAHAPQLVFRRGAGTDNIWQTPALASVQRLADFAMVVVITEDAETARAWIEQVRPVLDDDTPLIMVISAQAEPMVEPYYETASHQVHGLVTGLEGGMAYASLRGQTISSATQGQWGSYSYIVWVAVVLMVLAGLYNLALGWREARTAPSVDDEEEEA